MKFSFKFVAIFFVLIFSSQVFAFEIEDFSNSEWFARSAEFADNTEIYPLENGKVRMTMTFHRLAIPVN